MDPLWPDPEDRLGAIPLKLVSPAKGETILGFSRPPPGEAAPARYAPEGRFTRAPTPQL
jgi:hypothetical protein